MRSKEIRACSKLLQNLSKIRCDALIQFPDLAWVPVKMFRDGDHNNYKLQVKFYNLHDITMHHTIISIVNSVDKLRNEFQE